jgi:hypothetical protein
LFTKILSVALCLLLIMPVARAQTSAGTGSQPDVKATAEVKNQTPPAPQPQAFSEEEAAALEARAQEPGEDVAGGALSNLHLTYAVIALAAIVLVLIAK